MTRLAPHLLLLVLFSSSAFAQDLCKLADPSSPSLALKPGPARSENPGEITFGHFDPDPAAREGQGVRIARVVRRSELPGGPWATGDIGDYVLENEHLCVIVRGENRLPADNGIPGTGHIVDIAFRDQMWDSLAGLTQTAQIGGKGHEVRYGTVEIVSPPDSSAPPILRAYGRLLGKDNVFVITTLAVEPHAPKFVLGTQYVNKTSSTLTIDCMDGVGWGALPVFVGGYGIPRYTKSTHLDTHWICGYLDDFCVAIVNQSPAPIRIAQSLLNTTFLIYETRTLKPNEVATVIRTVLLTKRDMAPVSLFALKTKGIDYGWVSGAIKQFSDKTPCAGEEVEIGWVDRDRPGSNGLIPYGITLTDQTGSFRFPLPSGEYYVKSHSPGRFTMPAQGQISFFIRKGDEVSKGHPQTDVNTFTFEAVDAATSEPIPAKVRFEPLPGSRLPDFGPPWKAQGARNVYYLKPGKNQIPLTGGKFKCVFSRGPEYDITEKEVDLKFQEAQTIRAGLRRVVPTPGMVAVDLNVATKASPYTRVSAEDLVLAAAGEGLEWVFSGDLNQATDLTKAIEAQGLQKWIRASAGVHLSYQYPKLFGEFYVFPVPPDTPKEKLSALAGPDTAPADFFKAVRREFPGALISVMTPTLVNSSYLNYYNMDVANTRLPSGEFFSMDFDALEVFEGKSGAISRQGWKIMEFLFSKQQIKMPLASSRSTSLYYEEPGCPRTYLVAGTDDARAVSDARAAEAFRQGRYFFTNGPIIEQSIGGKWPTSPMSPPGGKFAHTLRISAAPWVPVNRFACNRYPSGAPFSGQFKPSTGIVRFDSATNTDGPWNWELYYLDPKTKELVYTDTFMYVQVEGLRLNPVVTMKGEESCDVLAVTPPLFLDANGDGKVVFGKK